MDVEVHGCTIPTDEPESDGTAEWESTTIVIVEIDGGVGFCSYSRERLQEQLGGWVADGIPRVKMKLGRDPEHDPARLDAAREAIGGDAELFVDANGAFTAKDALGWAERYRLEWGVS